MLLVNNMNKETKKVHKSILASRKFGENVMTEKEINKQEKSLLAKRKYGKNKD